MPGLDKSRFVVTSEQELDEFTCAICRGIFVKPMVTSCCRQTYCSDCINHWLSEHNNCPNDRKTLRRDDLSPAAIAFLNLLNNLRIKCEFEANGCKEIVHLSSLSKHIQCHKCKTCGLANGYDSHNCIEVLININKSLTKETTELKNTLLMSEVIGRARKHINEYTIELRSNGLSDIMVNRFIDKSKQMIQNYNTFEEIAHNLLNQMDVLLEFRALHNWNLLVYQTNGSAFIIRSSKTLRIRFTQLNLFLFL